MEIKPVEENKKELSVRQIIGRMMIDFKARKLQGNAWLIALRYAKFRTIKGVDIRFMRYYYDQVDRGEQKRLAHPYEEHIEEEFKRGTELPERKKMLKIKGSEGKVYQFQFMGVHAMKHMNGRVLLADEMRLGKTIQCLEYLRLHPEIEHTLCVVPAVAKYTWYDEIVKWLPNYNVCMMNGRLKDKRRYSHRANRIRYVPGGNYIYIINYDILSFWEEVLIQDKWDCTIFDESHKLKNSEAKRTKTASKVAYRSKHIICTTGTPLLNRPIEVFSSLKMLRPDIFNSKADFGYRYCNNKPQYKGATRLDELNKLLLSTVMIRRTQDRVGLEMPDKMKMLIPVEIEMKEYKVAEDNFIDWVESNFGAAKATSASRAQAIVKVNYLKMLAARMKTKYIFEWIDETLEESNKVLIGVWQKDMGRIIHEKYPTSSLTINGLDSAYRKDQKKKQFWSDDNMRILVGQIEACGVNVNLSCADTSLTVEYMWSPMLHRQFEDRLVDMARKTAVVSNYMIAKDTVEERLVNILNDKMKDITRTIDGKYIDVDDKNILNELILSYIQK